MKVTLWLAIDTDGVRHGWGTTAGLAQYQARDDYLALMEETYGPFERRDDPNHPDGPTTWTDGDSTEDSPEAIGAWASRLDVVSVEIWAPDRRSLVLGLCAVIGNEGHEGVKEADALLADLPVTP